MRELARRRGVRQFVKFGIVGASGFLVNFVIFTLLQRLTGMPVWLDFSVGYITGGVSNYFLNRVWTFRSSGHPAKEGLQFLSVSLGSLLFGDLVIWLLGRTSLAHHYHTLWFLSTLSGMLLNFFVNKYWTFKHINA